MGDIFIPPVAKGGPPPIVSVFGIPLPGSTLPMAVGSVGIMIFYCASSLAQEFVYLSEWKHTVFLTFFCKLMAAMWGGMLGGFRNRKAPKREHAIVGILSFATMWFSNASLLYLNYPSQTIFKSAKLIPVMLAGRIVLRKSFTTMQYLSAICLFLGLVVFTETEVNVSPKFHLTGILYISAALIADALIGNYQELMFVSHSPSMNEMLSWSNLYAALCSIILCIVTGEAAPAIAEIQLRPQVLQAISLYGFCNIIGIYFVLVMIYRFGAATTTFVTSLRKAVTVVLSFLLFTKPFEIGYLIGGLLVSMGIYLNVRGGGGGNKTSTSTSTSQNDENKQDKERLKSEGSSSSSPHPSSSSSAASSSLSSSSSSSPSASTSNIDIQLANIDSVKVSEGDLSRWLNEAEAHGAGI